MIGVLIKRRNLETGMHTEYYVGVMQPPAKELEARREAWNRSFPCAFRGDNALPTW